MARDSCRNALRPGDPRQIFRRAHFAGGVALASERSRTPALATRVWGVCGVFRPPARVGFMEHRHLRADALSCGASARSAFVVGLWRGAPLLLICGAGDAQEGK